MAKRRKVRVFLFSAVACLVLGVGFALVATPATERSMFLSDYGRTLRRMLTGRWEFSELSNQRRSRGGPFPRNGGRQNVAAIFNRLDTNSDGQLDQGEVGARLASSLGKAEQNQFAVSLLQFQECMRSSVMPRQATVREEAILAAETAELTADGLFDPDRVAQIEVRLPEDEWQSLCSQSRSFQSAFENPLAKPYTYFRGDIRVDGVLIRDVGIRKKGFIGSQDEIRPALKIKFNEFVDQQPIHGLDRLTLNNNKQDRALASQYLTYQLFRQAGLAAPRCAFATVTVNGKYLGIYSNVESVRKPFLRRSFGDESGKLYEGTLTDFYPKSIEWFEAKANAKSQDRSRLLQLATLLDEERPSLEDISQVVDLDAFLRYWALESLIHFWDGYTQNQNNFFVYEHPRNGLLYFVPWGADSCFGDRPRFLRRRSNNSAAVSSRSMLANRLYHIDGIPERYRLVMLDLLAEVWEEQGLYEELDRIAKLLFNYIDFSQIGSVLAMEELRSFIDGRREKIMHELDDARWPVAVAEQPRKPMYVVELGSATGTFSHSLAADQRQPVATLNATLTLEGQSIALDSATTHGLKDLVDGSVSTARLELSGVQEGEPIMLTLTSTAQVDESHRNRWALTGDLHPWSESSRGRQIRGEMTLSNDNPDKGIFVGKFDVQFLESKGGFMDRRRW